jgi:tetratricopeptide (TPR) repeat protein
MTTEVSAVFDEGYALHRSGDLAGAESRYRRVIEADRAHFAAHRLLGATGRFDDGVRLMRAAIALSPGTADVHALLGLGLRELGRPGEALASFDRALALEPRLPMAHNDRAAALLALHRPEEALASCEAALSLKPNFPDAYNNRGIALQALGRLEAAVDSFERALSLNPNFADAHSNLGLALCASGRPAEALASLDRAIALRPNYTQAHLNRGQALLLAGRFEEGWRVYAEHRMHRDPSIYRLGKAKPWTGQSDIAGKDIFVFHEWGLGDTIQFVRYVKRLEALGARVSLSVQAPLKAWLAWNWPSARLLGETESPGAADYYCALPDLPLGFATTPETIPAWPRYLASDPDRGARFETWLGPRSRPRVGLAWSGNPAHVNDRQRSIPFAQLSPLLSADVQWVAVQNEIRAGDQAAFAASGRVAFDGQGLADFSDTAALVDRMDLVITVDTSIAHLAGALGKPVWILIPFSPDWRWLLNRADSPWYPSARLFRQDRPGDWASVIESARTALRLGPLP